MRMVSHVEKEVTKLRIRNEARGRESEVRFEDG